MTSAVQELAATIEAILVDRPDLPSAAEFAVGQLVLDACGARQASPALAALGVADDLVAAAVRELVEGGTAMPSSAERGPSYAKFSF